MAGYSSFWSTFLRPRVEYVICNDISNGREFNKIPAYSYRRSDDLPGDFHYVTDHIQSELTAHIDTSFETMKNCSCDGNCHDSCYCSSYNKSGRYYNAKGRLSSTYDIKQPVVIYECNSACKCNKKTCINSVIQRGSRVKIALFKTRSRGWAVRALEDIKPGTFLGVYSGELITVEKSVNRKDDTYLFNLSSNIVQFDQGPGNTDTSGEQQEGKQKPEEAREEQNLQSSQAKQSNETEFVCDAKFYGNFTRFINHSCEPNVTGIRAYTSHYDKRFPHIAFFANETIPNNSELTLNYGDNYWLVKCKRDKIYCLCKTPACRFSKKTFPETYQKYLTSLAKDQTEADIAKH